MPSDGYECAGAPEEAPQKAGFPRLARLCGVTRCRGGEYDESAVPPPNYVINKQLLGVGAMEWS